MNIFPLLELINIIMIMLTKTLAVVSSTKTTYWAPWRVRLGGSVHQHQMHHISVKVRQTWNMYGAKICSTTIVL